MLEEEKMDEDGQRVIYSSLVGNGLVESARVHARTQASRTTSLERVCPIASRRTTTVYDAGGGMAIAISDFF